MVLTVRSALEHAVLRRTAPVVLGGAAGLDAPVRWVHSSEIYEIGPLLSGGELLLTTGLGIAGVDAGARRHYVRDLAERGVAGLAIEVGRSLPAVPTDMSDEAERRGLPLLLLREVVPFIDISEQLNTLIVGGATLRLRFGETVTTALETAQLEERGLSGLLAAVGDLLGRPLVLVSAAGALIAASGTHDDRHAWRVLEASEHRTDVLVRGQAWGTVAAGPADRADRPTDEDVATALRRLVPALALGVVRTHRSSSRGEQLAEHLLSDLVAGSATDTDVLVRAGAAGFHPHHDHVVVGVAVESPESRSGLSVLASVARSSGGALRGRVGPEVLALVAVPDRDDPVRTVAEAIRGAWQRAGRPPLRAAVGDPVRSGPTATGWRWTLARARSTLTLADHGEITTSRRWALDLLLRDSGTDLARLAGAMLEPLQRWDSRHGSDLVGTVETHLRLGCSPGRTASALRIGRQAAYQRLRRAEELLGHALDDPDSHAALLLAAAAARLSATSGVGRGQPR